MANEADVSVGPTVYKRNIQAGKNNSKFLSIPVMDMNRPHTSNIALITRQQNESSSTINKTFPICNSSLQFNSK